MHVKIDNIRKKANKKILRKIKEFFLLFFLLLYFKVTNSNFVFTIAAFTWIGEKQKIQ